MYHTGGPVAVSGVGHLAGGGVGTNQIHPTGLVVGVPQVVAVGGPRLVAYLSYLTQAVVEIMNGFARQSVQLVVHAFYLPVGVVRVQVIPALERNPREPPEGVVNGKALVRAYARVIIDVADGL